MFHFVLMVIRVLLCVEGYVFYFVLGVTFLLCVEGYVFHFVLNNNNNNIYLKSNIQCT